MERISITIPKDDLENLDTYVKVFAKGYLNDDRSAFIVDLIRKNVPKVKIQ